MPIELSQMSQYDDDHMSCARTHATLRVYSTTLDPDAISEAVGARPSRSFRVGDSFGRQSRTRDINAWFLYSEDQVSSRDLRRHLDWLMDSVDGSGLIRLIQQSGAEADIFCYWESRSGQGGPILSPIQMSRMSRLGLHLILDLYGPTVEAKTQ